MPSPKADTPPIFSEGTHATDTITFKSYNADEASLTFNLANAGQHYKLGSNDTNGSDELDLQLNSNTATISLTFDYDTNWTQTYPNATVTVTYNNGTPNSLPYTSPAVPPSPAFFSITLNTGSVQQIVWDPKIKVIAPPPTGS